MTDMDFTKLCRDCASTFYLPEERNRRCNKSGVAPEADGSLCGEMRLGACGPDAKLWVKAP